MIDLGEKRYLLLNADFFQNNKQNCPSSSILKHLAIPQNDILPFDLLCSLIM